MECSDDHVAALPREADGLAQACSQTMKADCARSKENEDEEEEGHME